MDESNSSHRRRASFPRHSRRFRGAQYHITIENTDGAEHGVRALYVNGKPQEGNLIAPAAPGSVVSVRVVMGN